MELSQAVVIAVVVGAVVSVVLIRWTRRGEAAAPVDRPSAPATPVRSTATAAREQRESQTLVNWLLERASEQTGVNLAHDALARERIVKAAAQATEDLRAGSATISLPFLTADERGPHHFNIEFKRNPDSTFEVEG